MSFLVKKLANLMNDYKFSGFYVIMQYKERNYIEGVIIWKRNGWNN